MSDHLTETAKPAMRSLLLPLGLAAAALLVMETTELAIMVETRQQLIATHAAQDAPLKAGAQLRQQINAIIGGLDQLAKGGDSNAQAAMRYLHNEGVNYTPPAPGKASP